MQDRVFYTQRLVRLKTHSPPRGSGPVNAKLLFCLRMWVPHPPFMPYACRFHGILSMHCLSCESELNFLQQISSHKVDFLAQLPLKSVLTNVWTVKNIGSSDFWHSSTMLERSTSRQTNGGISQKSLAIGDRSVQSAACVATMFSGRINFKGAVIIQESGSFRS